MATLNVQDYGAVGDGSSDDSGAIQSAIDDASAGDTVYFPAPADAYALYGGETILSLSGRRHPDGITLEGDGEDSVIRYEGGNGGSNLYMLRVDDGPIELTVRDLFFDGNQSVVQGDPNAAMCITSPGSADAAGTDILFEDVHVENAYGTGISWRMRGTRFHRVTSVNNGNHGLSYATSSGTPNEPLELERCYFSGNSNRESGYYGADTARGSVIATEIVTEENSGGGAKTSIGGEVDMEFVRCRFSRNGSHPYQSTRSDFGEVTFEDCVFDDNARSLRLSYLDYHLVGEIVVTGASDQGVNVGSQGTIASAEELSVSHNSGYGVWSGPGNVDVLNHWQNGSGPDNGGISVGTYNEEERTDLDNVPTGDEVGAWTDDTSNPDPPDPPEPEPRSSVNIATAGGVIQTTGGVVTMAGMEPTPEGVIDDFEGYDAGTDLADTGPWSAAGSYTANHQVTDRATASGSQSVFVSGSSSYNAVQSLEGDGLENYPSADCTIRIAVYLEAGSHDVAFGVPADEENYHNNCYRLRGGPLLSRNPSLKRTVDGDMETLVSLDNHFPTNTWLEHIIKFEATGSEVVLTYNGYAWDDDSGEWTRFESNAQGVDSASAFAEAGGVGLGTYAVGTDAIVFDNFRVTDSGTTAAPDWTPSA